VPFKKNFNNKSTIGETANIIRKFIFQSILKYVKMLEISRLSAVEADGCQASRLLRGLQ
jgi:hypothetical protein